MSDLVSFAYNELQAAGLFDEDSDYGGMIGTAVMELVQAFADQGHSGASAGIVIGILAKVLAYKPLSPLTGAEDEWIDVSEEMGSAKNSLFMNKRCFRVWKTGEGEAYDNEGKVFIDADGYYYTSRESRVPVTFPYTPTQEYIKVVPEEVDLPHSNC